MKKLTSVLLAFVLVFGMLGVIPNALADNSSDTTTIIAFSDLQNAPYL